MSRREKSVSVRFAAVGGDKVKSEMRGIGMAGRDAMEDIRTSSRPASAGLEDISAAALQARQRLEDIASRSSAAAASMRTTVPAATDLQQRINQATGVTPAGGMSAAETLRQGQALDDLRAKINPLYAEIRRYKNAVAEVRAAHADGAISADEQSAAIGRLRRESLAAIDKIKGISAANAEAARTAEEAARASARQAQELSNLRARYNPVYAATRRYKTALADLERLRDENVISSQEFSTALDREARSMREAIRASAGYNRSLQRTSRASRMGTFRLQQMSFQLNDIVVGAVSGQRPMTILFQQGTQLAQIYGFGQGGFGGALRDIGTMLRGLVTKFWPLLAVIAAGSAAIKGMQSEINETSETTVSFGDTALATFQVIGRGIGRWIKPAVDKIGPWFQAAWDLVVGGVKWVGNTIIKGIRLTIEGVGFYVSSIPDLFSAAWNRVKEIVFEKLADIVQGVSDALGGITDALNSTFNLDLSPPGADAAQGLRDRASRAGTAADNADASRQARYEQMVENMRGIIESDPLGAFFEAVRKQAVENAKTDDEDGAGGGSGSAQVDQLTESLRHQLRVLRETDPVKKKMLEYSQQLTGATDKEKREVLDLVLALDRAKNGWEAITIKLGEYAAEAKRIGDDIGDALVGGFKSAETAVGQFVKTGKLEFGDLVSSMLADMAKLASRRFIFGPLAAGLDAALGGIGGDGGFFRNFAKGFNSFDGGGWTGNGPRIGGLDGRGGFLAMMHPQERVYDEYRGQRAPQTAAGPTVINIQTRDAESFRRSRSQVAADLQRGLAMGRRSM